MKKYLQGATNQNETICQTANNDQQSTSRDRITETGTNVTSFTYSLKRERDYLNNKIKYNGLRTSNKCKLLPKPVLVWGSLAVADYSMKPKLDLKCKVHTHAYDSLKPVVKNGRQPSLYIIFMHTCK